MLYNIIKFGARFVRGLSPKLRLTSILGGLLIANNAFSAEDPRLLMSLNADRSAATALAGQTVSGNIHIFLQSTERIRKVKFFLDQNSLNLRPLRTDWRKPYDLRPSGKTKARPLDVDRLSNGKHFIIAKVYFQNRRQQIVMAEFNVGSESTPGEDAQISEIGKLEVSVSWLDFGEQTIGEPTASKKVVLKNSGTAPVTITQIALNGDFSWVANSCKKLNVSQTCSVDIKFIPAEKGNRPGALVIENDTKKQVEIKLTGIGDDGFQDMRLSWQPTSELITGYKVYQGSSLDSVDQLVDDVRISEINVNAPSIKLSINKKTQACFKLRAYNEFGISDFSEAICNL